MEPLKFTRPQWVSHLGEAASRFRSHSSGRGEEASADPSAERARDHFLSLPQKVGAGLATLAIVGSTVVGLHALEDRPKGPEPVPPVPTEAPPPPGVIPGVKFFGPVYDHSAPDPFVFRVGADYYLTHTGRSSQGAFPILRSTDGVHWKSAGTIFPQGTLPAWAQQDGSFWAPEIHAVGDHYNAYFTVRDTSGKLVIGVATSRSPTGPFVATGAPLVDDPKLGVIDPNFFHDQNGKNYVLWKVDGNAVGQTTPIMIAEASADGTRLIGEPKEILRPQLSSQLNLIEGPEMFQGADGRYHLFVAAGHYGSPGYHEDQARASSPTATFTFGPPVLRASDWMTGTGHASAPVAAPDGRLFLYAHAWHAGEEMKGQRVLILDPLELGKDGWYVAGNHGVHLDGWQRGPAPEVSPSSLPTFPAPA